MKKTSLNDFLADATPLDETVLDLYSGPGGMGTGFARHFTVANAVDWSKDACNTYATNHRETRVHLQDVTTFIHGCTRKDFDVIIGVIGGPPCQDFSVINKKANPDSQRADQLDVMVQSVLAIHPTFALIENVTKVPVERKERVVKSLETAGYKVTSRVINAWDYGAIQLRPRWLTTACLKKHVFPDPLPKNAPRRVASEILTDRLEQCNITPDIMHAIQHLMPAGIWVDKNGRREKHKNYFVLQPDRPFPCIINPEKMRYVHPDRTGYVAFDVLKQAQGFPADYTFTFQNKGSRGQQLANAVPVELAESFASAFAAAL